METVNRFTPVSGLFCSVEATASKDHFLKFFWHQIFMESALPAYDLSFQCALLMFGIVPMPCVLWMALQLAPVYQKTFWPSFHLKERLKYPGP